MSSATTLAPRACNSSTVARPMPLAAPVTITTLSFTSFAGLVAMVVLLTGAEEELALAALYDYDTYRIEYIDTIRCVLCQAVD